jgi:hypothetical protein
MARHLADLQHVLRPGAQPAYVVGDQASYLCIMIRTGQLLADLAQALGYEVEGHVVQEVTDHIEEPEQKGRIYF